VVHVGKRGGCKSTPQAFIEKLMLAQVRVGERVVRLKGGDPFVFGRGGEEADALRARRPPGARLGSDRGSGSPRHDADGLHGHRAPGRIAAGPLAPPRGRYASGCRAAGRQMDSPAMLIIGNVLRARAKPLQPVQREVA
jgi:hypothetical protein